ncbi:MAG: epoxyqueuosine reductase QueH [Lentisphaeria bacterium]|nr:epoxyqueuosine reductase QueH [Lentisphaeria bacterium]
MTEEILLHTCCAPCASSCVERLLTEKRKVSLYFSNSNICSEEEFEKRLHEVRKLAELHDLELIVDPYDHDRWLQWLKNQLPDFAEYPEKGARCRFCFTYSLRQTAEEAAKRKIPFCTSLTVSPHKNSKLLFEIGTELGNFECYDFKKKDGFKRSMTLARQYGFYCQNFCGCEFSIRS